MQEYRATRRFACGDAVIRRGDKVLFDGSTITHRGKSWTFPQLRSAVTSGWLVAVEK